MKQKLTPFVGKLRRRSLEFAMQKIETEEERRERNVDARTDFDKNQLKKKKKDNLWC